MKGKTMTIAKPIIEQPFTNEFGTINVGDVVVAVTTGYSHRVSVIKGRYLGYTESQGRHGQTEKRVKLEVQSYRNVLYYKGTDTEWKWKYGTYHQVKDQLETRQVPYFRKVTLRRNRIVPIKDSDHGIVETVGKLV
jgi:hypothetical protein